MGIAIGAAIILVLFLIARRLSNTTVMACLFTSIFLVFIYIFFALGITGFWIVLLAAIATLPFIYFASRGGVIDDDTTDFTLPVVEAAQGNQSYYDVSRVESSEASGSFVFSPGILPEVDSRYSQATAEAGTVYTRLSDGRNLAIGYYEKATNSNRIDVLCEHDRVEIGYIDEDGYIYLSRFGLFRRFNDQGENISIPDPMTFEVGRMLGTDSGTLDESNTHITIGHFTGNKFAAAAAFVCLVYECHNNYKHRRFFEGWY